jgi:hypothetical protein
VLDQHFRCHLSKCAPGAVPGETAGATAGDFRLRPEETIGRRRDAAAAAGPRAVPSEPVFERRDRDWLHMSWSVEVLEKIRGLLDRTKDERCAGQSRRIRRQRSRPRIRW